MNEILLKLQAAWQYITAAISKWKSGSYEAPSEGIYSDIDLGLIQPGDTILMTLPSGKKEGEIVKFNEPMPDYLFGGYKTGANYLEFMDVVKRSPAPYYPYTVDTKTNSFIPLNTKEYFKNIYPRQKGMGYIGGTAAETRSKFLQLSGILPIILTIAKQYNIDPNLVAHRFAKEGWTDHYINEYNYAGSKANQELLLKDLLTFNNGAYGVYGLDTLILRILNGSVKLKNQKLFNKIQNMQKSGDLTEISNEAGDPVLNGMFTPEEAAEIMAAYFSSLNDKYKSAFDSKTKFSGINNWNTLVNAMYNLGEGHSDLNSVDWINKNYTVPNYYKYGGKLKKLTKFKDQ